MVRSNEKVDPKIMAFENEIDLIEAENRITELQKQLAAVEARAFAFDKMTFELNDKLAAAEARCARLEELYRESREYSLKLKCDGWIQVEEDKKIFRDKTEAAIVAAKEGTK